MCVCYVWDSMDMHMPQHKCGDQRTSLELVLPFHLYVGSGNWTNVNRFTWQHLYSLSHLSQSLKKHLLRLGLTCYIAQAGPQTMGLQVHTNKTSTNSLLKESRRQLRQKDHMFKDKLIHKWQGDRVITQLVKDLLSMHKALDWSSASHKIWVWKLQRWLNS